MQMRVTACPLERLMCRVRPAAARRLASRRASSGLGRCAPVREVVADGAHVGLTVSLGAPDSPLKAGEGLDDATLVIRQELLLRLPDQLPLGRLAVDGAVGRDHQGRR